MTMSSLTDRARIVPASSSELALFTAERDEYRRNWQEAERLATETGLQWTAAEDARDDLQARIEAALELLDGRTTRLAVRLREVLETRRRGAEPAPPDQPLSKPRTTCGACGRDSAMRQDGYPQAHRDSNGEPCAGRSA